MCVYASNEAEFKIHLNELKQIHNSGMGGSGGYRNSPTKNTDSSRET
ncbi:hypothetical protein LINGRAHAP2_LOCUS31330 [Linum grandiflorum]